jgi:PAS domain S-box-containing protein
MSEHGVSDSGSEQTAGQPDPRSYERVRVLIRRLAEAEAALAAEVGAVDSVIDPVTLTPILLRQAQADLAASEARYNRLVAAMSAVVFELTPDGRVLFVNDAVLQATGYPARELLGQKWDEILLPGAMHAQAEELEQRFRVGDVAGYELVIAAKDGSRVILDLNSANRYGLNGALERIVGIATNITERKRAEQEVQESRLQLQALSHRLIEAVENERRTISRELHDQANQLLTSLLLGLGILEKSCRSSEAASRQVAYLQEIADSLSRCMHDLAVSLRPASLDRLGLRAALNQLIHLFESQTGLQIDLLITDLHERLPIEVETAVYRIVQESLTNVTHHAEATSVGVVVQLRDRHIIAIIEDDGKGFDYELARRSGRLGLAGMRERAEMLHGTFTIETKPGGGTTVYVELPCAR